METTCGLQRRVASPKPVLRPYDPLTYVGVFVLLLATAPGASAIPAMRAAEVDPMVALSVE